MTQDIERVLATEDPEAVRQFCIQQMRSNAEPASLYRLLSRSPSREGFLALLDWFEERQPDGDEEGWIYQLARLVLQAWPAEYCGASAQMLQRIVIHLPQTLLPHHHLVRSATEPVVELAALSHDIREHLAYSKSGDNLIFIEKDWTETLRCMHRQSDEVVWERDDLEPVSGIYMLSDGEVLVHSYGHGFCVLDQETGRSLRKLNPGLPMCEVATGPESQVLVGHRSSDAVIFYLMDATDGRLSEPLLESWFAIKKVAWTGSHIVIGDFEADEIRIFSADGTRLSTIEGNSTFELLHGETLIATCCEDGIAISELETGKRVRTVPAAHDIPHDWMVTNLLASPDGRWLLITGDTNLSETEETAIYLISLVEPYGTRLVDVSEHDVCADWHPLSEEFTYGVWAQREVHGFTATPGWPTEPGEGAIPNGKRSQLEEHYGFTFPDDLEDFWEFLAFCNPENPELALVETLGMKLAGPLADIKRSTCSPLLSDAYRVDRPEFLHLIDGRNGGFHWGWWQDEADQTPRGVCGYFAHDDQSHGWSGPSLFHPVFHQLCSRWNSVYKSEQNPAFYVKATRRVIGLWNRFLEFTSPGFSGREQVTREHVFPTVQDMGAVLPEEAIRPPAGVPEFADVLAYADPRFGSRDYRYPLPDWITTWIEDRSRHEALLRIGQQELEQGYPAFLLLVCRELWPPEGPHAELIYSCMVDAYRALGRDSLAERVKAHKERWGVGRW